MSVDMLLYAGRRWCPLRAISGRSPGLVDHLAAAASSTGRQN